MFKVFERPNDYNTLTNPGVLLYRSQVAEDTVGAFKDVQEPLQ